MKAMAVTHSLFSIDHSPLIRPQPEASRNSKAPAKLTFAPGSNGAGNKPVL